MTRPIHIIEGDYRFSFPASWGVRKYDDHTFYRGLSGRGLKAVDFVVLPPDGPLWLIEVKNYRTRYVGQKSYPAQHRTADELALAVATKYHDTVRAIQVIYDYYWRKYTFRWLSPWLRRSRAYQRDWVFWAEAYRRLHLDPLPHLLIWLELEDHQKQYRTRFYATLQRKLADTRVNLEMGMHQYNPLAGMEVVRQASHAPDSRQE